MPKYVICAYRPWNIEFWTGKAPILSNKDTLKEDLEKLNPEWVFFLDWSWIIPESIWGKYKCVMFHEAPLPKFRGGSPIQNQIIRGITKTKLTAFMMDGGLDTGDILLQEDLDLSGHIHDIMERVVNLTECMICAILGDRFSYHKQDGEPLVCKRRTPQDSELDLSKPLGYIYDFIRMLEDPYPNAFCYVGDKKFTFKSAEFDKKLTIVAEIE